MGTKEGPELVPTAPAHSCTPRPGPHLGVAQQGGLHIGVHSSGGPRLGPGWGCTRRELLRVGEREARWQWEHLTIPEDDGLGRLREAGGQAGSTVGSTGVSPRVWPMCPASHQGPSRPHHLLGLKAPWLLTQRTRGSTNSELNVSTGTRVTLCCGQKARHGMEVQVDPSTPRCPAQVLGFAPSPWPVPLAPWRHNPQPSTAVSGPRAWGRSPVLQVS